MTENVGHHRITRFNNNHRVDGWNKAENLRINCCLRLPYVADVATGSTTHLTLVTGCWFRFASTDTKWQSGISMDDLLRKAVSHLGNRTRCVISCMCHSYQDIYRQWKRKIPSCITQDPFTYPWVHAAPLAAAFCSGIRTSAEQDLSGLTPLTQK